MKQYFCTETQTFSQAQVQVQVQTGTNHLFSLIRTLSRFDTHSLPPSLPPDMLVLDRTLLLLVQLLD